MALELEQIDLFRDLAPDERERLASISSRRTYGKGETIFEEGAEPGSLRVLLSGLVSFRQQQKGEAGDVLMGTLSHAGDVFGIAALVGAEHLYPHSAVALEESEVIEIDGEQLMSLCEELPPVGQHILLGLTRIMAGRLSAVREQIRSRIRPGLISHG